MSGSEKTELRTRRVIRARYYYDDDDYCIGARRDYERRALLETMPRRERERERQSAGVLN